MLYSTVDDMGLFDASVQGGNAGIDLGQHGVGYYLRINHILDSVFVCARYSAILVVEVGQYSMSITYNYELFCDDSGGYLTSSAIGVDI